MSTPRKSLSPRKKPSSRKPSHGYPLNKRVQLGLAMKQLKTELQPHLEGIPTQVQCNLGDLHSVEVSRVNNRTFGDVYRRPHRGCPNKERVRVSPRKLDHLRFQPPFDNLLRIREICETVDNPRTPADQTAEEEVPASSSPATLTAADSSPIKQADDLRDFFNPGQVPTDTPIRDLTKKVVRTPVQQRSLTAIPMVTPTSPTKRARDDDDRESLSPIKIKCVQKDDDDDDKLWEEVDREFPFDIPWLSNEERTAFKIDQQIMDLDFPIDVYFFASDGQPRIERVHRRASKQVALEDVHMLTPYPIVQGVDDTGKIYLNRDLLAPNNFISVLRPYVILKLPQVAPVVVALWWAQNKETLERQYGIEYERYMK